MTEGDWRDQRARSLAVRLAGDAMDEVDERGRRITDDTLLILFNAWDQGVEFTLPPERFGASWTAVLDTTDPLLEEGAVTLKAGDTHIAGGRSVTVLRRVT